MTTFLSRRAALAAATGAGAATALTACASDIRPLADSSSAPSSEASPSTSPSASASASTRASASAGGSSEKSYLGPVKFDNYEKKGEYVPADETHKALNMPRPRPPANMYENTVDGAYAAYSFYEASLNYLVLTGDVEPLKEADPVGKDVKAFQGYVTVYETNEGWFYGSEKPVQTEMLTPRPEKASGSDTLIWPIRFVRDPNAMSRIEGRADEPMFPSKALTPDHAKLKLSYKDGRWFYAATKGGEQSTPSPSTKASNEATPNNA